MFSFLTSLLHKHNTRHPALLKPLLVSALTAVAAAAQADESVDNPPAERWNWHVQLTSVTQKHGSFRSPYAGANSLLPQESAKETVDATLFLGARLWPGGEVYLNPEFDQGYGLAGTLGMAGFPSGAAYKVGHDSFYGRLHRAFVRQTFALGDAVEAVEPGANQLGGTRPAERLTLTVGKISLPDLFDNNAYAHDPRADFLNWAVIDGGGFDYAADSWGFSVGAAAEWTRGDWTLRGGLFTMSTVPNSEALDPGFGQRQWLAELEHRHKLFGHPGVLRLLGFRTQARMANYDEAVAAALASGQPADPVPLRRATSKTGFVVNLEQEIAKDVGMFARYSANDGRTETFDFTDINKSLSVGLSLKGSLWGQADHTWGLAVARNGLSSHARDFLAAGGLGVLVGDGQLPHYRSEQIFETYYAARIAKMLTVTGDYQYFRNPGYNPDRGPMSVWGLRLHAEY